MKLHRIIATISLALAFTLTLGTVSARAAWDDKQGYDPSLGLARISYMTGDVLFYSPDTEEWAEVSPNFALREDDSLWVGDDSKAEVRFRTGETAWLNYQTGLDMLHMQSDDNGDTFQVGLPYGEASFNVGNFDVLGSVFQVDTPSASVRAYGRALFRVSSLDDGTTQVGVREGSVEVESEYGVLSLRPGDLMEVYPSGRSRVMELPGEDSWDDWVDARLAKYSRKYASSRYLPRDMDGYADEFDEYGSWVSYPEYGNVWVPRVSVGWSPYSYGRWVYVGYDYVWLPYDPWYAPYHYGRWYWDVSFGWFWIPPTVGFSFWSPGYVGWCYGPDYLYWVPLGPGELYYGYGYYGPRSVNIFIHKDVHVKNVYINSHVTNSVVVVDRHEFREGRIKRVTIKDRDNPFRHKIRDTHVVGWSPVKEVKPDRKLRFPKPDKVVTERQRPSKKVFERAKTFKERRVVTRSEGSAFRDKRPERMREVDDKLRKPAWKEQSEKRREREKTIKERPKTDESDTTVRGWDSKKKEEKSGATTRGRDVEKKEKVETETPKRGRWDAVRERGEKTDTSRERVKEKARDETPSWDRDRGTEDKTRGKVKETETKTRDRRTPTVETPETGRGDDGATRGRSGSERKRPEVKTETRTRETGRESGTTGGTPGWGRGGGAADTGKKEIYRETGSDRGSLQRDKGSAGKDNKADTGQPKPSAQPTVDDRKPSGSTGSWKSRDTKKPEPAVREGAGGSVGSKAVKESKPDDAKGQKRDTSAESSKGRSGSKDKSAAEDEPAADPTEYVPADSGEPGVGKGRRQK